MGAELHGWNGVIYRAGDVSHLVHVNNGVMQSLACSDVRWLTVRTAIEFINWVATDHVRPNKSLTKSYSKFLAGREIRYSSVSSTGIAPKDLTCALSPKSWRIDSSVIYKTYKNNVLCQWLVLFIKTHNHIQVGCHLSLPKTIAYDTVQAFSNEQ